MKRSGLLVLVLLSALAQPVLAQEKFEREYRAEPEAIALRARQFLEAAGFGDKTRWYVEESQDGKSVEAKLRHGGRKYSIEFDTLGTLQDVEIEIDCPALPDAAARGIARHLNGTFERFRFRKIQEQLTGRTEDVQNYLKSGTGRDALTVKYEIVLKGREDGRTRQYEYTFDNQGTFEKRALVVFRNTDNLEY